MSKMTLTKAQKKCEEFVLEALADENFDYRNLPRKRFKYQYTTSESYQISPGRPNTAMWPNDNGSDPRYGTRDVTRESSLGYEDAIQSPVISDIVDLLIKNTKGNAFEEVRSDFESLRSSVDPDDPETLSAYQAFLEEHEIDPKNLPPATKPRNEVIADYFEANFKNRELNSLADIIAVLAARKDISDYFQVEMLTLQAVAELKDQAKRFVNQTFLSSEGQLDEPSVEAIKSLKIKGLGERKISLKSKFTEYNKAASAAAGLGLDEAEANQAAILKKQDLASVTTDKIVGAVFDNLADGVQ